jgi:hypothetical protein
MVQEVQRLTQDVQAVLELQRRQAHTCRQQRAEQLTASGESASLLQVECDLDLSPAPKAIEDERGSQRKDGHVHPDHFELKTSCLLSTVPHLHLPAISYSNAGCTWQWVQTATTQYVAHHVQPGTAATHQCILQKHCS